MVDFDVLLQSLSLILHWKVLASCFAGVVWGMFVGVTPGLTGIMAVVIALPLTFFMDPQSAIALLLGIYVPAIYGGSVTAIMIATPGGGGYGSRQDRRDDHVQTDQKLGYETKDAT